jgi:5'-deoxynucleotidase YfbR-like HD superfamily hydrolase
VKRILSAVATAALGLCLLTACGGDNGNASGSGADYCKDLKSAKKEVDALKGGDFSDLQKTTDAMHKLADEAPSEIKDDWKTLIDGVDKLVAALKKAGLDDSDMATLQSGQIPDGVDMQALQGLMTEIKALDTAEFQKAGDDINKHAKDKCGVDLQA